MDLTCAVEGCGINGRPQVCPYDGRYHHHGRIHYEQGHRWHPDLRFREGDWHRICDDHYRAIIAGKRAVEEAQMPEYVRERIAR